MSSHGACWSPSSGFGKGRLSSPKHLIAEFLGAFQRLMSAMENHNAGRDRVWPRNYGCWIRAPGRFELRARRNGHTT
jgi:hypothetical protein